MRSQVKEIRGYNGETRPTIDVCKPTLAACTHDEWLMQPCRRYGEGYRRLRARRTRRLQRSQTACVPLQPPRVTLQTVTVSRQTTDGGLLTTVVNRPFSSRDRASDDHTDARQRRELSVNSWSNRAGLDRMSRNIRVLRSAPGVIRTRDPRIRNPMLYPTELRA